MGKQLQIKGTERKQIEEVNIAAEAYVKERDKRMRMTKKEVEARAALITAMEKNKIEIYRDDSSSPPLVITLTQGPVKVKVEKVVPEYESDGDDDQDDDEDDKAA